MTYATMNNSKAKKDDEWYTRMEDVEKEIPQHARYLKGKTVICPCDHPRKSRIYLYLKTHFHILGLKSLISSHYESPRSYVIVYDGMKEVRHDLAGDGDFLSSEVLMWMKRADVVITNPPFSLIRKWMDVILPMGIRFLYICPFYVMSYANVFPWVRKNKVFFEEHWVKRFDNNPKSLGMTGWITNLPTARPHPPLAINPKLKYTRADYDTLHMSKADLARYGLKANPVHVPKLAFIPNDYYGQMAVPNTILYKINYNQFRIDTLVHSPGPGIFKRVVITRIR